LLLFVYKSFLTKSETSGGSLFSKYEEEVRLVDLMDSTVAWTCLMNMEKRSKIIFPIWLDSITSPLSMYETDKDRGGIMWDEKGENKSWFREYSISEIRQMDRSSLISSSMEAVLGVEHKADGRVYDWRSWESLNEKSIMKSLLDSILFNICFLKPID